MNDYALVWKNPHETKEAELMMRNLRPRPGLFSKLALLRRGRRGRGGSGGAAASFKLPHAATTAAAAVIDPASLLLLPPLRRHRQVQVRHGRRAPRHLHPMHHLCWERSIHSQAINFHPFLDVQSQSRCSAHVIRIRPANGADFFLKEWNFIDTFAIYINMHLSALTVGLREFSQHTWAYPSGFLKNPLDGTGKQLRVDSCPGWKHGQVEIE